MRLTIAFLGLFSLIMSEFALARPLDDENNVREGDDAFAAAEKRDKIAGAKKPDAKENGPKPAGDKGKAGQQKEGITNEAKDNTVKKQEVTNPTSSPATTLPITKATTKPTEAAKTTGPTVSKITNPTSAPVTTQSVTTMMPEKVTPTAGQTTAKPEEGDVENSANNTKNMNGTTFHVAIRYTNQNYSDDLQIKVNPVYERLSQITLTAVEKVYQDDSTFKQAVIIGFSDSENPKKVEDKRQTVKVVNPPGVIVDFYLRFHTFDTHLRKLSAEITTGVLDSQPVTKKFIRAYQAEPKGRVCTPDCKLQCYSYCDQGCCSIHGMMPISIPIPAPAPAPAPAPPPAPPPAPAPAPAPAPSYMPPVQPVPYPNYAPMPPPAALPAQCPQICNTYCAPQCPNQCCTSYQNHQAQYPAAATYQQQHYQQSAYPAAYPAQYQAPMPAAYPPQYSAQAHTGCGYGGCGK